MARSGRPRTRHTVFITASAGIAALLAGCSPGTSAANSATPTSGHRTVVVQQQAGDNTEKAIGVAAKLFEAAHPDVTVKVQIVTSEAKTSSNLAVITGPTPPDVAVVPQNSTVYTAALAAKKLEPLDDVWTDSKLRQGYGPLAPAFIGPDGHPYLVSIDRAYYNVLYYNEDLFSKLGITVPSDHRIASTQDLYSIAAKLKGDGKAALAFGGGSGYQASWMLDALLPTASSSAQISNYLTSYQPSVPVSVKYTDEPFVSALSTLQQFAKEGVYQNGFLANKGGPASEALFEQQRTAMVLDGSWAAPSLRQASKFKVGWLLLPPVPGGQKTQLTAYAGDAMAIPTGAKDKADAKLFLDWWFTPEAQQKVTVEASGSLPAVDGLPAATIASLDPLVKDMVADVAVNGSQSGWTSTVPASVAAAFTDPLVQSMYAGQKTPDDVGAAVQGALEKMRAGH